MRRSHGRGVDIRRLAIRAVAAAVILVVLSGGAAFAGYRYDRAAATRLLPGVHVGGVDVGEMTAQQALDELRPLADRLLSQPLQVRAGNLSWKLTPRELGARVDVEGAVETARREGTRRSWWSRLYHRLLNKPVDVDVDLRISYDRAAIDGFLQDVTGKVLDRKVEVRAGDETWLATPRSLGATAAVKQTLGRILGVNDLVEGPAPVVTVPLSYDEEAVTRWIDRIADDFAVAPDNASLDYVDSSVVIDHAEPGRALDTETAGERVMRALKEGHPTVSLDVRTIEPDVTEDDLGDTIIVDVSLNELYLYDGTSLVKSYDVATGTDEYPTPLGHWTIINKRENPTWVNPSPDGWGKDLPESIPPGPGNPLGTRALDLNAPGIRIHGTYADYSVGSYASHGCIRMHIPESEELFELVEVGTPVIVAP